MNSDIRAQNYCLEEPLQFLKSNFEDKLYRKLSKKVFKSEKQDFYTLR